MTNEVPNTEILHPTYLKLKFRARHRRGPVPPKPSPSVFWGHLGPPSPPYRRGTLKRSSRFSTPGTSPKTSTKSDEAREPSPR